MKAGDELVKVTFENAGEFVRLWSFPNVRLLGGKLFLCRFELTCSKLREGTNTTH